jgi:4'-phosphopantetheinyl transferase EntD
VTCSLPDIDGALRALAPRAVLTGSRRITGSDMAGLHAEERELIKHAVPKRQHEFATGRALLRQLLGASTPVMADDRRAPRWPAGFRGSLAHDDRCAVAAITQDLLIRAVGIDVEPTVRLADDMAALILRPEEQPLDAHLVFCLKEAAYKAWSAMGGRFLDHQEVLVSVRGSRFDALVVDDDVVLEGRFTVVGDRTVALVVVASDI